MLSDNQVDLILAAIEGEQIRLLLNLINDEGLALKKAATPEQDIQAMSDLISEYEKEKSVHVFDITNKLTLVRDTYVILENMKRYLVANRDLPPLKKKDYRKLDSDFKKEIDEILTSHGFTNMIRSASGTIRRMLSPSPSVEHLRSLSSNDEKISPSPSGSVSPRSDAKRSDGVVRSHSQSSLNVEDLSLLQSGSDKKGSIDSSTSIPTLTSDDEDDELDSSMHNGQSVLDLYITDEFEHQSEIVRYLSSEANVRDHAQYYAKYRDKEILKKINDIFCLFDAVSKDLKMMEETVSSQATDVEQKLIKLNKAVNKKTLEIATIADTLPGGLNDPRTNTIKKGIGSFLFLVSMICLAIAGNILSGGTLTLAAGLFLGGALLTSGGGGALMADKNILPKENKNRVGDSLRFFNEAKKIKNDHEDNYSRDKPKPSK